MRMTCLAASALVVTAGSLLGACSYGVRSNPVLRLTDARVSDSRASLQIEVDNPSDSELTLRSIDYEVVYGPLPVASGTWEGRRPILAGQTTNLTLAVEFDSPHLDPAAPLVELVGTMSIDDADRSADLALTEATFRTNAPARR